MDLCNICENLIKLRVKFNYSQSYVSKKLHIDRSVLSRYERGALYPSIQILIELANFYNVSIDYLLSKNDLV